MRYNLDKCKRLNAKPKLIRNMCTYIGLAKCNAAYRF